MWNKTPEANAAATVSAHKTRRLLVLLGGALVVLVAVLLFGWYHSANAPGLREANISIRSSSYRVRIAETPADREQGLSGTPVLQDKTGLLFRYDTPQQAASVCFWMKDMNYPIDIIWFDAEQKAIYIKENALPEDFPEQYCPPEAAQYVLEVPAGDAGRLGMRLGDRFETDNL